MAAAARLGDVDMVAWLLQLHDRQRGQREQGQLGQAASWQQGQGDRDGTGGSSAGVGAGGPWYASTFTAAAGGGCVEVLRLLAGSGCPMGVSGAGAEVPFACCVERWLAVGRSSVHCARRVPRCGPRPLALLPGCGSGLRLRQAGALVRTVLGW